MQGIIIKKSKHSFGAFKYISDLWHPTQKNAGKIDKATQFQCKYKATAHMTVIPKIASVSQTQMAKYLNFQHFSFPTFKECEYLVSDMSVVFLLSTEAA
jgi:hypothetical protein